MISAETHELIQCKMNVQVSLISVALNKKGLNPINSMLMKWCQHEELDINQLCLCIYA